MTVTCKKLASLTWLAGAERDGSLWVVSKNVKYSPACEQTQRCISAYSKPSFKHHWPSGPLLRSKILWSFFDPTVEFHWHLSLPTIQLWAFSSKHTSMRISLVKNEREKWTPTLTWTLSWESGKGMLENPKFCNPLGTESLHSLFRQWESKSVLRMKKKYICMVWFFTGHEHFRD